VLVLGLLALGACHSGELSEAPVAAPRVATHVHYQLGGPLRGGEAPGEPIASEAFETSQALTLRVAVIALALPPELPLAPLVGKTKLVVLENQAQRALAATPRRLAGARVGSVPDAGSLERLLLAGRKPGRLVREVRACLPRGASVSVELTRDSSGAAEDADVRRSRIALVLGRRDEDSGLDGALELEEPGSGSELVAIHGPDFEPAGPSGSTTVARWAALFPSPFEGDEARSFIFIVETGPGPLGTAAHASVHEETLARARRELAGQTATLEPALALAPEKRPLPDLGATCRSLLEPASARRALYALATATGSELGEELSVAVDDLSFLPIASSVAAAIDAAPATAGAREVGLLVEKAVLERCREVLLSDDVPDDLLAALERRGGAALRLLPSLATSAELDRAKSVDEIDRFLEEQNLELLEDASPKIRVRAARWLARRMDLQGYVALDATLDPKEAAVRRREIVARIREGRR
jgi:hypothetical protein